MIQKIVLAFALYSTAIVAFANVVKFHVSGLESDYRKNVLVALSEVDQNPELSWTESQIQNFALAQVPVIGQALQPYGYYHPNIQSRWTSSKDNWTIHYTVNLGPITMLDKVDVQITGAGRHALKFTTALQRLLPETHQPLNHQAYEKAKSDIISKAIEQGYLDAYFIKHEIKVDVDENKANIILELETGPEYFFGPLTFSDSYFSKPFLDRFQTFKEGQPFYNGKLLQLQGALRNTDYFESVVIQTPREEGSTVIPVHVSLVENPKKHLQFGFGYRTNTGLQGKLGYSYRFLNPTGHRWDIMTQMAERRQTWRTRYQIPGAKAGSDRYEISLAQIREDIDHQISDTRKLSLSSIKQLTHWQRIVELQYYTESYRLSLGDVAERSHLVLPTMRFIRFQRNDPINPTKGYRIDSTFRGSINALASTTTFAQWHGRFKLMEPGWSDGHWTLRSELGTTIPNSDDLPLSLRYFAGGDSSIRGYAYRSIGPTVKDARNRDAVIGGKHLALLSAEYEQPIMKQLSLAVFIDTGTAMDKFSAPLKTGVGFGLHLHSLIGPIRFDLAHPLNSENRRDWRFHLLIGPEL